MSKWYELWGIADITETYDLLAVRATEDDICNHLVSPGARLLFIWIKFAAAHRQRSELSVERLTHALGVGKSTTRKWLAELATAGMLDIFDDLFLIEQSFIYFIQSTMGGPIKIGKAINPIKRLEQLQTGYPEPLQIIGVTPGTVEEEKNLHHKFLSLRLHGEWFNPGPELIDFIKSINSHSL